MEDRCAKFFLFTPAKVQTGGTLLEVADHFLIVARGVASSTCGGLKAGAPERQTADVLWRV
jgi:hypothetical protein